MIIGLFKESSLASSSRSRGKRKSRSTTDFDSDDDIVEVAPHPKTDVIGWAYVGSHNFTPSAWGNLSGSAFNPVMNVGFLFSLVDLAHPERLCQITNYELGIAFPLRSEKEVEDVACYRRPPRKYVTGTDEPWVRFADCFRILVLNVSVTQMQSESAFFVE